MNSVTTELRLPADSCHLVARLKGIRNDFESGFLDDAGLLIRSEVAADYLSQADQLLRDGLHVPAAVLSGSVLEDALRKLCDKNKIPTDQPNGKRKTLDPLNTDLAKTNVYSATKAAEVRAWIAMRNQAVHGDGAKNDPDAVKRMHDGILAFISEYLR